MTDFRYRDWRSPFGLLRLIAEEGRFTRLQLPQRRQRGVLVPLAQAPASWRHDPGLLPGALRQLQAYAASELRHFDLADFGLPLHLVGTDFQRAVWQGLLEIPWGQTCSYGELASRIGRAAAVRAVGAANGANPIALIVPCHRVIAADGRLHGYGGGLALKQQLLTLEQAWSPA